MAFNGYLLKLKGGSTPGVPAEEIIPLKPYIRYDSYKVKRNVMDLDPTRSLTGLLYRNPLQHTASKIEFEVPEMDQRQLQILLSLIRSHFISPLAKDVELEYYLPETDSYYTGHFYMPDIEFNIRNIDQVNRVINYGATRIAFVEY